eukprot:10481635-Prorocentrum_lima.AAC.1
MPKRPRIYWFLRHARRLMGPRHEAETPWKLPPPVPTAMDHPVHQRLRGKWLPRPNRLASIDGETP